MFVIVGVIIFVLLAASSPLILNLLLKYGKKASVEYVWEIVQSDKRDVTIGEYSVTITTKNGDVITVAFSDRLTKKLITEKKNVQTYDYENYDIKEYIQDIRRMRNLQFHTQNGSGTFNSSPIRRIDYIRTNAATIEICRETHTRKIKE